MRHVSILVFALLVTLSACGGGAASLPPTPADAFLGTYFHQSWAGDPGPASLQSAAWGTFDADGFGMITGGTTTENTGGSVFGPEAVLPLPYAIGPGGLLTFTHRGQTMEGGLTADGAAAVLGSVGTTNRPALAVLGRRAGAHDAASFAGDYHLCGFFHDGVRNITWWGGTATFDGAGGAEARWGTTSDGVATPADPTPSSAGTCSVSSEGDVIWVTPDGTFQGGILLGGELVVLSGLTVGGVQGLLVLVRQGTALSAATFDGSYHMVWIGEEGRGGQYASMTGAAASDGMGGWWLDAGTANLDGAIHVLEPSPSPHVGPYSVSPNGALWTPGLLGGVSPSGRVAVVAGETYMAAPDPAPQPSLIVFLR